MMQEFVANRMSSGNRLFPDKVTLNENGITLRSAGFFNGKEKTLHYHEIISVESNTPLVGFSTIKFKTVFDSIICSGFTKDQVEEMKYNVNALIANRNGYGANQMPITPQMPMYNQVQSQIVNKDIRENELHLEREKLDMEKKKLKQERADKFRQEGRNLHAFFVEYDSAIITTIVILAIIIFITLKRK